jgi:hypothetical protein
MMVIACECTRRIGGGARRGELNCHSHFDLTIAVIDAPRRHQRRRSPFAPAIVAPSTRRVVVRRSHQPASSRARRIRA